tara:strand:- start:75 stop:773 length:699 start_codon:yes stop_codon:yes gene_type:complete
MTKPEFINLFPLTLYKARIELSEKQKKDMVNDILEMKKLSQSEHKNHGVAWAGYTHERQDLFDNNNFKFFFDQVSIHIKNYLTQFQINIDEIDCYFHRSWATVSDGKENIKAHFHAQSHLTFAFYLDKSPDDANLQFTDNSKHNEFIPSLFTTKSLSKNSLFKERNINNVSSVDINCLEGDIIIFPSKTIHSTQENRINKKRISISADIVIVSKNNKNLEFLVPPTNIWKKF